MPARARADPFACKLSTAVSRNVAEAIRAANQKVDLDRLQPGTSSPSRTRPTSPPRRPVARRRDEEALAGLSEAGAAALEELVAAARTRESEGASERKQLARALEAQELVAAAREYKAIGTNVKEVQVRVS